jgi:chloride channel 7
VGALVGFIAYLMTIEDVIGDWVIEHTTVMIQNYEDAGVDSVYQPWMFFAGWASVFGLIASVITTYYGPAAAGSGVAELVGYLNGVNYPGFITIHSLITKVVGVTFAVLGKLAVGKEGPLAHIGAISGALVLYLPGVGFEFLRNDEKKRCLIAAGASAGVSCAFGAPIGGALFAYEMSKPNTFWKFEVIWKVFCSCAIANFTMGLMISLQSGIPIVWGASVLKFGSSPELLNQDNFGIIGSGAVVLGIFGGIAGPVFIWANTQVNNLRKVVLDKPWKKVVETPFLCFLTASAFFIVPRFDPHCIPLSN